MNKEHEMITVPFFLLCIPEEVCCCQAIFEKTNQTVNEQQIHSDVPRLTILKHQTTFQIFINEEQPQNDHTKLQTMLHVLAALISLLTKLFSLSNQSGPLN